MYSGVEVYKRVLVVSNYHLPIYVDIHILYFVV